MEDLTARSLLTLSRRSLLGTALAGSALWLAGCTSAESEPLTPTTSEPTPARPEFPAPYVELFSNSEMNFEAMFCLGSVGICSDAGEALTAVAHAHALGANPAGFYTAFLGLADRVAASAAGSRPITARARYLRAAKYYSQALFFVLGSSTPEKEEETYLKMDAAWTQAAALSEPSWQKVAIPYENSTLPGWFCPSPLGGRQPTVIVTNGSDGQNIDIFAYGPEAGLQRGYNILMYDGPGQGEMLFVRTLPFRYDWEAVVTPIVDYLLTRSDVDPDRIALTGWSMGGDLVARAAAFEPRLAAIVSDTGLVSPWLAFPAELREIAEAGDAQTINHIWTKDVIPGADPFEAYYLAKRFEIFSTAAILQARAGKIPTDFFTLSRAVQAMDLTSDVIRRISQPYLVTDYEAEGFYAGQAQRLYDQLTSPKTFHKFTAGARYHCAPLAPATRNEFVFDWLDETLGL